MPRSSRRHATARAARRLAFALCASLPGAAAAGTLAPVSIEPRSFESLTDWTQATIRPCCVTERIAVEGMVLLEIRARLDVAWSDALTRLSIPAKDISVLLPDGTELGAIGAFQNEGQFMLRPPSLSASRPRDWPASDADAWIAPVFLIPAGTPSVTFRVAGQVEAEVAVPAPGVPPVAADFAEFRLLRADRTDRLALTQTVAKQSVTSEIAAAPGYEFLELELAVTGRATNSFGSGDRFQWHTYAFHLADERGETMGLIGERFMDRVLGWQFNSVKVGETATRKVIWTVPAGLGTATLLFGETPVLTLAGDGTAAVPAAAVASAPATAARATAPAAAGDPASAPETAPPAAADAPSDLSSAMKALAAGLTAAAAAQPKPCAAGTPLEVEWNGAWLKATVREGPDAEGRCRIGYDGLNESWDEWVGVERMRAR